MRIVHVLQTAVSRRPFGYSGVRHRTYQLASAGVVLRRLPSTLEHALGLCPDHAVQRVIRGLGAAHPRVET
jgi:hypothetical protein